MFRYAVNWGYLKENPALGIAQWKENIEAAEFLEKDEVTGLLEACEAGYRPIFVTAIGDAPRGRT